MVDANAWQAKSPLRRWWSSEDAASRNLNPEQMVDKIRQMAAVDPKHVKVH